LRKGGRAWSGFFWHVYRWWVLVNRMFVVGGEILDYVVEVYKEVVHV
jgi:hypothetical protein